jgi:hypothetical protein
VLKRSADDLRASALRRLSRRPKLIAGRRVARARSEDVVAAKA